MSSRLTPNHVAAVFSRRDLERLGLARQCYRGSVYAARRREAAKLGYSANESGRGVLNVELAELVAAYVQAVDAH